MKQEGKLNPEQFALAMYLVQQKQAGKVKIDCLVFGKTFTSLIPSHFFFINSLNYSKVGRVVTTLNLFNCSL